MIKIICDHCGNIAETGSSYFVYYTGRSEADGCNLCKKCFEEFLNWMKNKSVRDLWFNHCKELAKECNALHNKADEIITGV